MCTIRSFDLTIKQTQRKIPSLRTMTGRSFIPAPSEDDLTDVRNSTLNGDMFLNNERHNSGEVIRTAQKPFKLQLIETFATLMTAAFGMVAALAWNEAIKALIAEYIDSENAVVPLLIYAIVVTVIAVICIVLIARSIGRLKESMEAEEARKAQK